MLTSWQRRNRLSRPLRTNGPNGSTPHYRPPTPPRSRQRPCSLQRSVTNLGAARGPLGSADDRQPGRASMRETTRCGVTVTAHCRPTGARGATPLLTGYAPALLTRRLKDHPRQPRRHWSRSTQRRSADPRRIGEVLSGGEDSTKGGAFADAGTGQEQNVFSEERSAHRRFGTAADRSALKPDNMPSPRAAGLQLIAGFAGS